LVPIIFFTFRPGICGQVLATKTDWHNGRGGAPRQYQGIPSIQAAINQKSIFRKSEKVSLYYMKIPPKGL
jgi:hypothetical protein